MGHVQALHVKSQLVQAPLEDVLIEVADMLRIQGPARLLTELQTSLSQKLPMPDADRLAMAAVTSKISAATERGAC